MDTTTPVILKVSAPEYKKIIIETSEGKRYYADLSSFSSVYCFPKSLDEWKKVSPDCYGFALVWSSRFEVHMDQVIDSADTVEDVKRPS